MMNSYAQFLKKELLLKVVTSFPRYYEYHVSDVLCCDVFAIRKVLCGHASELRKTKAILLYCASQNIHMMI